jgi:hypothetical protein
MNMMNSLVINGINGRDGINGSEQQSDRRWSARWNAWQRWRRVQGGRRSLHRRRGAAAVEFAMIAPLFVIITLGVTEAGRLFEVQNQLALAVRQGGRLGAMDRTDFLKAGETCNSRVTRDVLDSLRACGLPADRAQVFIVNPDDHTTPISLDDPANDLRLFEVRVELPCSEVLGLRGPRVNGLILSARVVFRNARTPTGGGS